MATTQTPEIGTQITTTAPTMYVDSPNKVRTGSTLTVVKHLSHGEIACQTSRGNLVIVGLGRWTI